MQPNKEVPLEKETTIKNGENPPSQEGGHQHKPITSFSDEDKPREKMMEHGARSLTNSELLAILVGTGTPQKTAIEMCQELLEHADNSLRKLYDMDWRSMTEINGIGAAKAITIKAALEIGHRVPKEELKKVVFRNSEDIFNYIKADLEYLTNEEIWIIFLRNDNSVIGKQKMTAGGQTSTVFDCKEIVRQILFRNASAIVMVHNHPSGNLTPSKEDKRITATLKDACALFNVRLLDHIIIGENEYFSFVDSDNL